MIGTLNPEKREVTIVGAGIAGLLLAYRLDRQGWTVTLLEAAPRVGGLINTRQTEWGPAEAAAHSLLATPPVRELCAELGVELEPVRRESRARYVWRKGRLRRFPLSVGEALRAFLRAYLMIADRKVDPDRATLEQWGRRFLGEPALKYLVTPFVRGIYGARPSELNVRAAFPALVVPRGHSLFSWFFRRWHLRLRGKGGPKRQRGGMVAPSQGMGALVAALEERLRGRLGKRFITGRTVSELPGAENLVLCVPAAEAARLLQAQDPALASALEGVRYAPLVSVTAFVEKLAFPYAPRGVGVLLPEGTERKCLGALFNSSAFPDRVRDEDLWVSLTIMMGGTARPELYGASEEELLAAVRTDLQELFDLAPGARIEAVIHRWQKAIPIYDLALREAWDAAARGWCSRPGRALFGNYTGQVSVRGMIETAARVG